jgi:peroxiredoxin
MKKMLLAALLLPLLSPAQDAEKDFKLKSTLRLAKPADWVYLYYRMGDNSVTDSTQPKNGKAVFTGKLIEPSLATFVVKYAPEGGNPAKRESVPLFLEPGKIELTANGTLKNNTVEGSAAHKDFVALGKTGESYDKELTLWYEAYTRTRKAGGDKKALQWVEDKIDSIENVQRETVYGGFIKANPSSPIAVYALNQYAGYEINADKVDPLFNGLSPAIQQWPSAVSLKDRIEIARKTGIGKYAMDFTQNDTLDRPFRLSSLKGKYVLVDFWASWCGPCRAENPNVVKAYNQYKDKNFTVLGVSLDRPGQKEKWLKAIHDDGLTWNHVSDLKFWDNEVAKQYGIRAIPQNLLLDADGKIIAKNIRGEELNEKLDATFNPKSF